jgi:spore germination cell wall hydrolase CwlJ-like protein
VQFVCLAQAIYFEARGETPEGQLAVGRVVLNRVASEAYPDTICDVVYQNAERANRCQFSFACDGKPEIASERAAWGDALDEAGRLVACKAACPDRSLFSDPLWRSTHFHANYVSPGWASGLAWTGQIGRHLFYRDPSVAPYRSAASRLGERLTALLLTWVPSIRAP